MTEFEINKAVAEKVGIKYTTGFDKVYEMFFFSPDSQPIPHEFDPCNKPHDAWKIMIKHNICVTKGEFNNYDAVHNLEYYTDGNWIVDTCVSHEKPLVAAMLCFLEINK